MRPFNTRLAVFMSAAIAINYLDRVNISHALPVMAEELSLNEVQQGAILSAFSVGYVLFMAAGGYLADRFGPFKVGSYAVAFWSLAAIATGFANSATGVYATRLLVGMGEAPIFPAFASIVRNNFPLNQRGRATAIFDGGSYIGTALSAPIMVGLIVIAGWRWAFVFCGLIGIIWTFSWIRYQQSRGSSHAPANSKDNHAYSLSFKRWLRLVMNRKIASASFGFFCYNYSKSFFLTWFPTYLIVERGFSFIGVGVFAIIPPLCAGVGALYAGYLTDRMISNGYSLNLARKLPICFGLVSAIIIVPAATVEEPWLSFLLLTMSFTFTISASPGIWAIPGDLAPSSGLVSVVGSIQNTFSNLAGFVAPLVTGALVFYSGSFVLPLSVTALLCVCGALSYWFGVGDLQPVDSELENE